jgi:transposase-like protein
LLLRAHLVRLTPIEIVARAIWLYVRFNVSLREVEGLMLEHGVFAMTAVGSK